MRIEDESIQRIKKNLPQDVLFLFQLMLTEYHSRGSKVEEMQKALEWYADKKNWELGVNITMGSAFPLHEAIKADKGKRARECLKGVTNE